MSARAANLVGALACVLVLSAAAPAAAYCRSTTCDPTSEEEDACWLDENGCEVGGHPLFWRSRCATYSVQRDGSPLRGISFEDAARVIADALAQWSSVDCGGQAPSLEFIPTEPVDCNQQEYNDDGPNANIWTFRDDDWPYEDEGWTLALTTTTFDVETGEIYDADVEVNTFEHAIGVGISAWPNDLESIITHEAGHVLGLGHSLDLTATMYPIYVRGMCVLGEDDRRGMCAVYPPYREAADCVPVPRHGFSTACGENSDGGGCGCTIAAGPQRARSVAALLVWLVAAARRSRRRSCNG